MEHPSALPHPHPLPASAPHITPICRRHLCAASGRPSAPRCACASRARNATARRNGGERHVAELGSDSPSRKGSWKHTEAISGPRACWVAGQRFILRFRMRELIARERARDASGQRMPVARRICSIIGAAISRARLAPSARVRSTSVGSRRRASRRRRAASNLVWKYSSSIFLYAT